MEWIVLDLSENNFSSTCLIIYGMRYILHVSMEL